MRIKPITRQGKVALPLVHQPPTPAQKELDALLKAVSVARALNDLSPSNDFSVIRDPRTGAVVIAIRRRASGELIDLCPPDDVFDMLEHLPGQLRAMEE